MREDKLCDEAFEAPHTSSPSKTKRVLILLGIVLVIVLVPLLCFSLSDFAFRSRLHGGKKRYLNHYTVDNETLNYGKFHVELELDADSDPDFGDDVVRPTENNKEIKNLKAIVTTETDHRLHLKIIEVNAKRWEVPINYQVKPVDDQDFLLGFQRYQINDTGLRFTEDRFSLTLHDRDAPNDIIFTTENTFFRYMEKYLVIEFSLPSGRILGLGERLANMNLREGNYTLFNRDQGAVIETGANPGHNLYGSHPFLLYQLNTGKFAGIFFKTSNALQVDIKKGGLGTIVRYSTIGGIMDFYMFYKGGAEFIIEQYQALVGRPALPPLWSLGYHYGRGGIKSLEELKKAVKSFVDKDIPVDAIWLDSQILDNGKNFVLDNTRFKGLKQYIADMKTKHNIHFVPVLEPGITKDTPHFSVMSLVKNKDKSTFIGKTHVGEVGFPNFWKEEMKEVWKSKARSFIAEGGFDGFWLNLNEFSQICDGDCKPHSLKEYPFVPGGTNLEKNTLPMDAIYETNDDQLSQFLTEFNVHSLNPLLMANTTFHAFDGSNERVFLATRSSYPGIQQFAPIHWLGETTSNWEQLKYSIPSVMSFATYGMPIVGASICGFNDTSNEELCDRWTQLGLLYPLSLDYKAQATKTPSIRSQVLTKNAIRTKYSILRNIYTAVFEQTKYGGLAIKPTFFEFPEDSMSFRTMDRSFMYGKYLLVSSPLEGYQKTYSVYLPNSNWFAFPTGVPAAKYSNRTTEGTMIQVNVENDAAKLFVRGGGIVTYQDAIRMGIKNTQDLYNTPMTVVVALDNNNEASGRMVADDGISNNNQHRHYSFTFRKKTFKAMLIEGHNYKTGTTGAYPFELFTEIKIFGASSLKDTIECCLLARNLRVQKIGFKYDSQNEIMTLFSISVEKLPWSRIETISLFEAEDYNFCAGGISTSKIKVTDELRKLSAEAGATADGSGRQYIINAALLNDYTLSLKMTPKETKVWEVPDIVDANERNKTKGTKTFGEYFFGMSIDSPDFIISKPSDPDDTIITLQNGEAAIDDQFIKLRTLLKAKAIYGLGERVSTDFALGEGTYTLFSRDEAGAIDDGTNPGKNLYGDHPFLMFKMFDGSFGGIFFLNSNPMDVLINAFTDQLYQIDYITTGGLVDLFVIQSGPPKLIIQKYHELIGKPHLLPYWAFGNHQARYGYRSQKRLEEVVANYQKAKIPLDVLWIDIDYMDALNSFTIDKKRYPSMQEFVDSLHSKNIKFVPIVEPAIPINNNNVAYKKGLEMDVFLQSAAQTKYKHVVGMVWAGYSTFVDFVHPESNKYWSAMLNYLSTEIFPFDGIWLDMNEVTNFCDGECTFDGSNKRPLDSLVDSYYTPYVPGHRYLERKSLPLSIEHHASGPGNCTEFNMHSLYGHYQIKATNNYFAEKKQRPFIISRSTFAGSGRYGSHWLGDNKSTWAFLAYSIIGIYNFQMFGIPFTGADVCGFAGNTTIELCQRWYQLAAFYPFCRNHNDFNTTDQEPYIDPKLAETANSALRLRYSLIRYFYTLHLDVAINGGMYFMPLFFEFMDDPQTYIRTQHSFMVGSALKVTPVLDKDVIKVNSYFPNSNWYELDSGLKVMEYKAGNPGKNISLQAGFDKINVHIRGGSIIPMQNAKNVLTTSDLKNERTEFVVAPNHLGQAEGFILFDDEISLDTVTNEKYARIHLKYTEGKLSFTKTHGIYELKQGITEELLGKIRIFNAKAFSKTKTAWAKLKSEKKVKLTAQYNNEVLNLIPEEDIPLDNLVEITWEK